MLVTESNFNDCLETIRQHESLVVDLETTGLRPYQGDRLIGIAILAGDSTYYFPFRHAAGRNLSLSKLGAFSFLSDRHIIAFNAKFDLAFLICDGFSCPQSVDDVMLMAHLMNENEASFALKKLGDKYCGSNASQQEKELQDKLKALKVGKGDMVILPPEEVAPYAEQDVSLTWQLYNLYQPALERWGLADLCKEINAYMLTTLDMERRGISIDVPLVETHREDAELKIAELREQIVDASGGRISNPASPKQISTFFDLASSAAGELQNLDHPLAKLVLDYRAYTKVNSTYYDPFLLLMDDDQTIHCNFNLHGTVTGRLSCSTPNLQQVPRSSEDPNNPRAKVKQVFKARDNHVFVSLDYSQADMRIATHYAQEQGMAELLAAGRDIHTETAVAMGLMQRYEPKQARHIAKTINFGIIYGIGASRLADSLGVPEQQAKKFLDTYHRTYPGFRALYKRCEHKASSDGYIRMWTGRVRRFAEADDYQAANPPHKAMPNLIQGGVAEVVRVAMQRIDKAGLPMILQIHDDIMCEVAANEVDDAVHTMLDLMQGFDFMVPMVAEPKVGTSWGSLVKYEAH